MFSKLVFIVDNEHIEFQLHELVRVLQYITEKQKANAQIPSIPEYADYADIIVKNFNTFLKDIIEKHAKYYRINKNILNCILQNFISGNVNEMIMSPTYHNTMNLIKSRNQPHTPFIKEDEFNRLILPPFIPSLRNISAWLGLAFEIKKIEEKVKRGWWVEIGQRIILLRNLPNNQRQHFYVSDHGNCVDVIAKVKQNSIGPNSEDGRKRMSHCYSFWKHYQGNLSKQEKKHLKKHFIIMLHQGLGGTNLRNEFLLFVLSLPKSYRDIILRDKQINHTSLYMGTSIGMRDSDLESWVDPPNQDILKQISKENYKQFSKIFKQTLERIRYLGGIQTTTFISQLYRDGLNSFFLQIDQIFNRVDAEQYKIFFVLNSLALELGKGLQEFLLRPPRSFGSTEEGESYRGFSKAFDKYFLSGSHSLRSPNEVATIMRDLLGGKPLQDEKLYFLPNLVSAWFISETARNEVSILSGLMLLDLIESKIKLLDEEGNDHYSWRHVLIHPKKPLHSLTYVPIEDMYGEIIDLANFDGIHPMVHTGSKQDSKTNLGENQKLSAVRQKEGHLAIHWLSERLKITHPELAPYTVVAKSESESTKAQPCCLLNKNTTSYTLINKLLKANSPSLNIKEYSHHLKKWQILHKVIIPLLKSRLETFDHLLSPTISQPPITQLDITAQMLASLLIAAAPVLEYLIPDADQCQIRALHRAQDYRWAQNHKQQHDRYPALGDDWIHHDTLADGNCALSAIALGLLHHRNNGANRLTVQDDFRRNFAQSFNINLDAFTALAFSQVIDALLSPQINLENPIIKQIIATLSKIENTALGTEQNQIDMKIKAANGRIIKSDVFENGNVRPECFDVAIRSLARQGIIYQLVMAYVLRLYCVPHNQKNFYCYTAVSGGVNQIIEYVLKVTNKFGEYLDDTVIAFLANKFTLTIKIKANEFGSIVKYGTDNLSILIFNLRPGQADSHFELILRSDAEFLEGRLKMPNTKVKKYSTLRNLIYPRSISLFGVRENKATGPRVAKAIAKISEKQGRDKACKIANQFHLWAKHHHRHFNMQEINAFIFKENKGLVK